MFKVGTKVKIVGDDSSSYAARTYNGKTGEIRKINNVDINKVYYTVEINRYGYCNVWAYEVRVLSKSDLFVSRKVLNKPE